MRQRPFIGGGSYLPLVLTIALAAAVLALSWYGYRAVREWRRSTAALIDRTAQDGADLLVITLTRDMRGAQALVLADRDSGDYATQSLADFSYEVASAFTRYIYPESFFGWRQDDGELMFFNRASRTPPWLTDVITAGRYPVVVVRHPEVARPLLDRIRHQAGKRLTYAHFDAQLAGVPYEIVARLQYADVYRERLESITGFTVNLAWVRQRYFSDLVSAVSRMGDAGAALEYAVLDEDGSPVAGTPRGDLAAVREFPLQFFDPAATELDGEEIAPPTWKVRVSAASNPMLGWATSGEDTTLLAIAATALGLAITFLLTAQSMRTRASLAAMRRVRLDRDARAENTARHDPRRERDDGPRAAHRRAPHRVRAPPPAGDKRLGRLVDNLLAYARIIDVRDLYNFERLAPAELIEDSLSGFERQLSEGPLRSDHRRAVRSAARARRPRVAAARAR